MSAPGSDSPQRTDYEVAILGGGPAGSTAAALLARAGRRVVVLEREKFPRFHIGESLLPRSIAVLNRTGVLDKIERAGFIRKFGAEISPGCGSDRVRFYFKDGMDRSGDWAFQVPRAEFDKLLLDHAAACGAEVREQTAVASVDFSDDGASIALEGGNPLTAAYVIDCTGRHSLLAQKFGMRRGVPDLRKIAVFAHYEDVARADGMDGTLTRMVRARDRWFWLIPLTPTRMSVGVVMDSAVYKNEGASPESVLEGSISSTPPMLQNMKGSRRDSEVYVSGDYSYTVGKLYGERWLAAGDAAGFIDPVFSSGVFLAILGAEQAADAVQAALTDPKSTAKRFASHERRLRKVYSLYLGFVRAWYRQEFIETVLSPREFFGVVAAVNAVLAGNTGAAFALRWRLALFRIIVALQRYVPICPRIRLSP